MPGLSDLMKQAQAVQEQMQQAQAELENLEVTGEAGAGMVSVTMTGRHDVRKVHIDDTLIGEDKEMLEDLIASAVNDAVRKAERASQDKMSGLMQGFNIPGGLMGMKF
ncbi:MAG: YbaB/EbfC family nucleoid-associated protein [Pseudomonadota bacterium]